MSSIKDIKQRMTNVRTTKHIMKAMDMVSTTKLQKARQRLDGARPIYQDLHAVIEGLRGSDQIDDHIYTRRPLVQNSAYIVITSDKGLCGSYNTSVCEAALAHMAQGKNEQILAIGAKGIEFFNRRNKKILRRLTDVSEAQIYEGTGRMGELVRSLYLSGRVDEVFIAYTHFESTLSHVPRVQRVLPLLGDAGEAHTPRPIQYGPDAHSFISHLIPLYLHMVFFTAACESVTCEHAARMLNMASASKNATEIIDDLNRMYNRKRQAAITQELNEIVGGANILNQQ